MTIYNNIIQTKNNSLIPILKTGKTIESRYNPEAEAEKILNTINISINYYVIIGIGSGILIKKLQKKNPECFILAIEYSEEDINFVKENFFINNSNKNLVFTSLQNLNKTFINTYIPSFYGNLQIIEQKVWCMENPEYYKSIKLIINKSLEIVSGDFSVQSHFGKIWHKNQINNLRLSEVLQNKEMISCNKNAYIFAAGPSLDQKIFEFKKIKHPESTIIATDTTLPVLIKNNITPDFVVTIDSQYISSNHYRNLNFPMENTFFIFDLSSNPSAINFIHNRKGKIIFSISQHPLSQMIYSKFSDSFISLKSGRGTVTISAVDLAYNSGAENIYVYGADFAYSKGKAYTKGTYLDSLYNIQSQKNYTSETIFDSLQYRTELIKIDSNHFTTNTLNNYKLSLENYCEKLNLQLTKKNDIYCIQNPLPKNELCIQPVNQKQIINFVNTYKEKLSKSDVKSSLFSLKPEEITLLPLISWIRNHDNITAGFEYFMNRAKEMIKDY